MKRTPKMVFGAPVCGLLQVSAQQELTDRRNDYGNDEPVNAQNTRHNDRQNGTHNQIWAHHSDAADAHAALGSAVGRAEVCMQQQQQCMQRIRGKAAEKARPLGRHSSSSFPFNCPCCAGHPHGQTQPKLAREAAAAPLQFCAPGPRVQPWSTRSGPTEKQLRRLEGNFKRETASGVMC